MNRPLVAFVAIALPCGSGTPAWSEIERGTRWSVLLLLAVVSFVVLLTELVSNTASAALPVPIFLGVGNALGLPPGGIVAPIAGAAFCAFMLLVATPPNTIFFATDRVPQASMMRCGLALNTVCALAITVITLIKHLLHWLSVLERCLRSPGQRASHCPLRRQAAPAKPSLVPGTRFSRRRALSRLSG